MTWKPQPNPYDVEVALGRVNAILEREREAFDALNRAARDAAAGFAVFARAIEAVSPPPSRGDAQHQEEP